MSRTIKHDKYVVKMPYDMFLKEHITLINMLHSISIYLKKESEDQKKELDKIIDKRNKEFKRKHRKVNKQTRKKKRVNNN